MFGKRHTQPAPPDTVSLAATRVTPRSPSEALKPQALPPPPARVRRPRGGLLSLMSGLLTAGAVAFGAVTFGLLVLGREVDAPGPLSADKIVFIPKGTGTSEIAALLAKEGVIANPSLFELYAYLNRSKGQLKAGEFLFKANVDIAETIDTLIGGKAILHSLTIPEGLTSEQIVQRLRDNDILTGEVREIPREGSLLPDTYKFERGQTRQQFINGMQAAERDTLAKTWAKRAPDLTIRTPQELVILASIVEKETGRGDERARVASVFLNRLGRRMKLQSDPTIVYGIVGGKGTLGRGILRSEIEKATPYNTYTIEGLPPGPIANPGRAALEAVANPVKTKDLYFVADGTGGHAFAETYDQHLRNVARWRQLERSRESAPGSGATVDRADPPTGPEQRSDGGDATTTFAAASAPVVAAAPLSAASAPAVAASSSAEPAPAPAARRLTRAGFDAVEGTSRDPLNNQSWDLSSAKTVPSFGPEPAIVQRTAAPSAARRTAQSARRRGGAQAAEASAGEAPAVADPRLTLPPDSR